MYLKLATTFCLIVGVCLFLPYAGMLAHPPSAKSPKAVRRAYVEKLFLLNGVQVLCLVGAGVGAVLIVRNARREFKEQAVQNMRRLMEKE